jgi:hypothetical protein
MYINGEGEAELIQMGKVNLTVDDKVENEFRQTAFTVKGMKKGFLTDATQEAMGMWADLEKHRDEGDDVLLRIAKKWLGIDHE